MIAALVTLSQGAVTRTAQAASTNSLRLGTELVVVDASTGDPINPLAFKYIVNVDNTGTTDQRSPDDGCSPDSAGYPESCNWTSMRTNSSAPIYTQGDEGDFAGDGLFVDDGRYLISVLADGYKLDGAHFSMPLADGEQVVVKLQPTTAHDPAAGLPDATIQAAIFEDNTLVNGAPDLPAEHGLAGFRATLLDYLGDVTTDVYGNPLCTIYVDNDIENGAVVGSGGNCESYCYAVEGGVDIGIVKPDNQGRCPTIDPGLAPTDPTGLKMWPLPAGYYSHPMPGADFNAADVPASAAIEGKLIVPHLGTNRYALSATAPDGTTFIQTTTLEGNHDWDSWVMEGATGLDTEFTVAGEPFPAVFFGFVRPSTPALGGNGKIKGTVDAVKVYVPAIGGLPNQGTIWGGLTGAKIDQPMANAWIALNDLNDGDRAIWVGQADANGYFEIPNVPNGSYTITWWDEPQDYILDLQNVTVVNGETQDLGILPLGGWWTTFDGYVFNDANRNGKMDWTDANGDGCPQVGEGELGVPNYTLTLRKRENSLMDRGTTTVGTDACGHYFFESGYPMTQWLVMEAYNDLYYTTGVTYQADNQPDPTTVLGAGVDVSVLPIIGLGGRMDWGVHAYDATGTNGVDPQNGGIVGTVSYDTTRNELDPRYAAVEDWQPGVSGLTVDLYAPVACPEFRDDVYGTIPVDDQGNPVACDPAQQYQLADDGSYLKGTLLNTYVTETWARPGSTVVDEVTGETDGDCVPRDVDGNPLTYPDKQQITNSATDCLEAPLMGVQFQKGFSTVDGNYGFGDGCFNGILDATDPAAPVCVGGEFTSLGAGDYLVSVEIPDDAKGKPQYKFTREEDINIANGDQWVPQVPPPACAGALHTVDVANIGSAGAAGPVADNYAAAALAYDANGVLVPSDSPDAVTAAVVHVPASKPTTNDTFVDIDGSPYDGQHTPLCDTKLVGLNNGRSIVPTFNVFTDVPLPGRFWGLLVDDLNFSSNKHQINYGEKAGIGFAPVGIYDYTNRLVYTTESDYSGLFDVLLPSTNRISCPTPSGVCANLYRFVGNDPGSPGHLNSNWNPQFRTIAAEFEAFPGLIVPADLAPTQVGVTVQLPGGQTAPVQCAQTADTPQLFAVSKPFVRLTDNDANRTVTIKGVGFGATQSGGQVTLDGVSLTVGSWSDGQIAVTVPASVAPGPHQLSVKNAAGKSTVNGLTFHVLGQAAPPLPTISGLDNFNRANANNLGSSWTQLTLPFIGAALRVNSSQALASSTGTAFWNTNYGSTQAAAFTVANTTINGDTLILKASNFILGGLVPTSFITVGYTTTGGSRVVVSTTANGQTGTFNTSLGNGDIVSAVANADGSVDVWKTTGAITTYLGRSAASASFTGGGRIGMQLSTGARVDNFAGGNVAPSAAGAGYNPNVYEVGPSVATPRYQMHNSLPGAADHAIQHAIDDAAASNGNDLIVVYPGAPTADSRINPQGAYYENLIMHSPVKLQGVGPGGFQGTTWVPGTILDGSAFGGDSPVAGDWQTAIDGLTWSGNQTINDGAIVSVFAQATGSQAFGSSFKASIDGFELRGGDQQGFPTNINEIGGGPTGLPAQIVTQGGAVFANAFARYLQITNNVVENNGGGFGTIRIGTPNVQNGDNSNDHVRIANNRILANGGTNLAGAIALFKESDSYEVANNDICGNFSAEYGGGISHYGRSVGSETSSIHDNKIWFNRSYDEGAGIMIAGELPSNPTQLSQGSGPVKIYNNLIQANLANDDGGGLRFLMVNNAQMDVYNNMIVNNVSTHEGGGVALDDAANVRFFNNTVMKNLTTATAATSDGKAAPAGLSTAMNSAQLQQSGQPAFTPPVLFNNIFWDNRAGHQVPGPITVQGLGLPGDLTTPDVWDLGSLDPVSLSPTNSVISQTTHPYTDSVTNSHADPAVVKQYDTVVSFDAWRTNPAFIGAIMVTADLPPTILGNYHIATGSPAINLGAASVSGISAPTVDIDLQTRVAPPDAGADELVTTSGPATPSLAAPPLDMFTGTSGSLGPNWSQVGTIAKNGGAYHSGGGSGSALWISGPAFGANQLAAFTVTNSTPTGAALILKASGGTGLDNHIRVRIMGSSVSVATTRNRGVTYTTRATFSASFVANDKLVATADSQGTVKVYKVSGSSWTLLGSVVVPATGVNSWAAGSGRVGIQLSSGPHIDDFVGQNLS